MSKLKLYGFNNLTKALSFNIYDVCYAKSEREQRDYIDYIDEQYNSERLTSILYTLTAGLFGIGYLVDFIKILCGKFTDKDGNAIRREKK